MNTDEFPATSPKDAVAPTAKPTAANARLSSNLSPSVEGILRRRTWRQRGVVTADMESDLLRVCNGSPDCRAARSQLPLKWLARPSAGRTFATKDAGAR